MFDNAQRAAGLTPIVESLLKIHPQTQFTHGTCKQKHAFFRAVMSV
jgi:hypothetical protein